MAFPIPLAAPVMNATFPAISRIVLWKRKRRAVWTNGRVQGKRAAQQARTPYT